ncbi:hypothetical protein [Aeromonas rivipollensis]|uniref:hypothetical protein n=1 Tax=Aeromonas rivipollensis TaxID=948519 RepID=UPI00372D2CF9
MFIDINLKSSSKDEMFAVFKSAGFVESEDGALYMAGVSIKLLPYGMVTRKTGAVVAGPGGIEIEETEPVPGYHANVRTTSEDLAATLAPVSIDVPNPQYVWA